MDVVVEYERLIQKDHMMFKPYLDSLVTLSDRASKYKNKDVS